MNGPGARRVLAPAAAALALAGAAALVSARHVVTVAAGDTPHLPAAVPVASVVRGCPSAGLAGAKAAGVAVVAASAVAGPGRAVASRLGSLGGAPLLSLATPAVLSLARVPPASAPAGTARAQPGGPGVPVLPARGGVVIQASGGLAGGLEAEQDTGTGGWARCASPGTGFWFTGPGRYTAAHIRLYLMNVAGQPADVSVSALTDAGPVQGSADTGIAVPPRTMVAQSLDTMLRGSRVIALHVRTSVGQVVAAVEEDTGKNGGGTWLPGTEAPAARLLIPGLPATPGARQLFVTVPGTQGAHLSLTAVTARGSYHPTGGAGLDIPGGSAVSVSLPSLGGIAGALLVRSTVPVTASVLVPGGQRAGPGVFTAAMPAIEQQGVVAAAATGRGTVARLVLSAPWRPVVARVAGLRARAGTSAPAARTVRVAAHHSVVVVLRGAGRGGSTFAVAVTPLPGSGPLYAGRVLAAPGKAGTVQSILPVASALTSVRLPQVRAALVTPGP